MFDSNGEITPPCGVPASVSLTVPSSITPASSHWRINFSTLRSEIRSFTNSIRVSLWILSKEPATHYPPSGLSRACDDHPGAPSLPRAVVGGPPTHAPPRLHAVRSHFAGRE